MGRGTASAKQSTPGDGPAITSSVPLACVRQCPVVRSSPRTVRLQRDFGVGEQPASVTIAKDAHIRLGPGRLILLSGPSSSGKSSALSALEAQLAGRCSNVASAAFTADEALIDQVAPHAELAEAASVLNACGLGEAGLWLKPFDALSDGQKFRAKLACAISQPANNRVPLHDRQHVVLCDEFCSGLHRRAAKAIAHNLRKLATRRNLSVVVACAADDLTADLDPHCVAAFSRGACAVEERAPLAHPVPSFRGRLRIEPGTKSDYDQFAAMHYRDSEELGFVDRIFVLRDGAGGEPLGIVVYAHAALELSLRNTATAGWFSKNPDRVNRHLRVLRRLVIHPDVRGCGLGHYMVKKTLPLVGISYVECLAAMGEFNPVFEKAGMTRIGQYDVPSGPRTALEALRLMDIDPHSPQFALNVAKSPSVRAVVASAVADWYAATTGGKQSRVERQSPEFLARTFRGLLGTRPVYYLWQRRKGRTSRTGQTRRTALRK